MINPFVMKTPVKIALAVILFIAIGGIFTSLYMFNLKPKNLSTVKPDFTLTASGLQKAFEVNETDATAKYVNKTIEVSGEIISVRTGEKNFVNVSLKTDNPVSSVLCTFPPVNAPDNLKPGTNIVIHGNCSGYLMDVLLKNCAVVMTTK
jgi:hypothetical protein